MLDTFKLVEVSAMLLIFRAWADGDNAVTVVAPDTFVMSRVTAPPAVLFTEMISTAVSVGAYVPAVLVIIDIVSEPA
jgi:hypothetical protein